MISWETWTIGKCLRGPQTYGGDTATALEYTEVLRNKGRKLRRVWKELCYRQAETLGDTEEAVRWWRYNLVR